MTKGSQLLSLWLLRLGEGFASLLFVATPAQAVFVQQDGPRTAVPDEFCIASIPGSRSSDQQGYYFPTTQHIDARRAVCRATSLLTGQNLSGQKGALSEMSQWLVVRHGLVQQTQLRAVFLSRQIYGRGKEGLCLLLWGHQCLNSWGNQARESFKWGELAGGGFVPSVVILLNIGNLVGWPYGISMESHMSLKSYSIQP